MNTLPWLNPVRAEALQQRLRDRILVIDGAMGTLAWFLSVITVVGIVAVAASVEAAAASLAASVAVAAASLAASVAVGSRPFSAWNFSRFCSMATRNSAAASDAMESTNDYQ